MKISLAGKPINRAIARNCFLINQFATPGLGSLMARRFAAGIGQLSLALVGFALTVAWFSLTMVQTYNQISDDAPAKSFGWLGAAGALVFAVSWLWALATSLSLLR